MDEILDAIEKLRRKTDTLFEKRFKNNLYKWDGICVAVDCLEDSQEAINQYVDFPFPSSYGGRYLYIYGLLQALFVQQNALMATYKILLNKKLEFNDKNYPELKRIRDIRNDCIGHPTGRGANQLIAITRVSIKKEEFEYAKYTGGKILPSERINVKTLELIKEQRQGVKDILEKIIKEVR